jgi:tetratricopeptide (TPR) repeat protein
MNAMMALIRVYEKLEDYQQLNHLYGRLIHDHLAQSDKEAALYAYDSLLSAFPDDKVEVRIAARDWIVLCDYLKESGMTREAAVEYDRLSRAHPNDPLAVRACVDGGEAALEVNDVERALRLFEQAQTMFPSPPLASRISAGVEKCRMRLAPPPAWTTQRHTNPLS